VPTYQYTCSECGNGLEVVQKFTDDPLTECPVCHGRLRKVFSPVGVVFKGSGFYRNDSRSSSGSTAKSSSNGGSKDSKDSSGSDSSGSTSSTKSESSGAGSSESSKSKTTSESAA
jgi:putative FmdB family regulatory protein